MRLRQRRVERIRTNVGIAFSASKRFKSSMVCEEKRGCCMILSWKPLWTTPFARNTTLRTRLVFRRRRSNKLWVVTPLLHQIFEGLPSSTVRGSKHRFWAAKRTLTSCL